MEEEIAYLQYRETLQETLSDAEFIVWAKDCEECVPGDYVALVDVLLDEGLTHRIRMLVDMGLV
jgi:SHS2 domain-containing protein